MAKESIDTLVVLSLVETLSTARSKEKRVFSKMMVVLLREPMRVTKRWVRAPSYGPVERHTKVTFETILSTGKDL